MGAHWAAPATGSRRGRHVDAGCGRFWLRPVWGGLSVARRAPMTMDDGGRATDDGCAEGVGWR
jgi:hypothetical protein